jgi:glycosyltransferase involved in cell wall biosynthesis
MKILIVHNRRRSSSPSGEDRAVDQEHDALVDAGHDVRRFERSSDDIVRLPLRRRALVPFEVVWNPQSAHDLTGALETFEPDVVHLHNLFPMISPSVLQSCRRRRVPCVVTFHNYGQICSSGSLYRTGALCRDCVGRHLPTPGIRHGCYRGSSAATLPVALAMVAHRQIWRTVPSAYVFISDAQRREHGSLQFPPSRCFVKPNFVLPVTSKVTTEDMVVYLGRLTEAKGLRVLMRAWEQFARAEPAGGLRLAIAGSGPLEEEIRAWAGSRPSVEVLGLLDREECTSLVRRARAVVAPSEWPEPFGLVVAEAMAAGVAPVATAHGSFVEMITDGVDGLLYPPGDWAGLARLLHQIEDSPTRLAELGSVAKRTYERRFERTGNVAQLESIYRFALGSPRWLDVSSTRSPAASGAVVHRPAHP